MTRLQRAMFLQARRISRAFGGSLLVGGVFSWTQFSNDSILLHVLVAGLASYLVFIPAREFLIAKTVRDVYKGNRDAMRLDAIEVEKQLREMQEEISRPQTEITIDIVAFSGPVGKYKDFEYHETIIVKAQDGSFWNFNFNGTLDIEEGITQSIGDDELLLYPGVLYKRAGQADTSRLVQ